MNETWEWVDGYDNTTYTDDMIFEVDPAAKQVQKIEGQTLVSGENKAQFIRFIAPRFVDGVDLSEKTIQIIYITEGMYSDINIARCVERCEDKIRFGWVVPLEACYEVGTLSFSIEAVGDAYTWKTRVYDLEVVDGLNGGEVIPEPTEKVWYIELQERCDYVLNQAEAAKQAAAGSAEDAALSESRAAASRANALASEEAANASKQDAEAAAASAIQAAEDAAAVFEVVGTAAFIVAEDGGVKLRFTQAEE